MPPFMAASDLYLKKTASSTALSAHIHEIKGFNISLAWRSLLKIVTLPKYSLPDFSIFFKACYDINKLS